MLHDLRCILKCSFMENQCKNLVDWRTGSRTVHTNRECEDSSDRETNSIIRVVIVYPQLWNAQLTLISTLSVDIESQSCPVSWLQPPDTRSAFLCFWSYGGATWHAPFTAERVLLSAHRRWIQHKMRFQLRLLAPQDDESFLIWSKGWRISGRAEFVDAEFG